jgi:hypothetical protein
LKSQLFALLLFATVCAPITAQDVAAPTQEVKFRGAYLGQPLSDYVDCTSRKAKANAAGYRLYGHLCDGKRGQVVHTKSKGLLSTQEDGEILWFDNRSLVNIQIEVPNADWEKVKFDLTKKMGEPLSTVPDVYQNGFGARWKFDHGFWRRGDVVAVAGMKVRDGYCGGMLDVLSQTRSQASQPCSDAIEINITTAQRAGTPDTKPNSLD